MGARVVTNHHIRRLRSWQDLPADARPDFDYVEEDERWSDRFVEYRGAWHDVMDAQVLGDGRPFGWPIAPDSPLQGWNAAASDSAWTATIFRWPTEVEIFRHDLYSDRDGYIIVGRYISD